ncbi:MAG: thioesterase family protein [Chloroflexota bacterium]|nr:thioesterase family protein [Chloroflexota bacterium]
MCYLPALGDLEFDTRLSGGNGRYTTTLSEDWAIWGPNGGYLAAVALRAAGMAEAIKRPVSIACHFLGVARFEPVDVEVRAVQSGRRAESLHVAITQGERAILQASCAQLPGVEHNFPRMPEAPPPSQLKSFLDHWPDPPDSVPFWQNIDLRIIYPERIFDREHAHDANVPEWYRYQRRDTFDDPFVDAASAVILMDTIAWPAGANPYPPSTRTYQAVNLDVVAWFYEPESPWLLCDYDAPLATGGLVAGRGLIWSEDGRLVAMGGAQLFCIQVPGTAD